MQKINATDARNSFFTLLETGYLNKEEYVIYKSGIPVMVLVPYKKSKEPSKKNHNAIIKKIKTVKKDMKKGSDSVQILREQRRNNG